jgi:hypothetical protein
MSKEEKINKKSLWEHKDNVFYYKNLFDNDDPRDSDYTQYMINRVISMSPRAIRIAQTLNRYRGMPDKAHHDYLVHVLPQAKDYSKYLKGKKEASLDEIEMLMTYFEVGINDAREYHSILSKEQMKRIKKKFNSGKITKRVIKNG